jgi:hypothetical protein
MLDMNSRESYDTLDGGEATASCRLGGAAQACPLRHQPEQLHRMPVSDEVRQVPDWFLWPLIVLALLNGVIGLLVLGLGIASRLTRASRITRIRSPEHTHNPAERDAPAPDADDEGWTSGSGQQAAAT